jgi:amidase
MNRREFLQLAALGTAQALISPAFAEPAKSTGASSPAFRIKRFQWEEATITDLQAAMASGKENATSLTRAYLRRIEEVDQRGPALNAILELNPDALAIARALDRERKA